MRTFVVTIEEPFTNNDAETIFAEVKGVSSIAETTESKFKNLALPGSPLSDNEMEELAQEMEDDIKFNVNNFLTVEKLKANLDTQFTGLFASNKQ